MAKTAQLLLLLTGLAIATAAPRNSQASAKLQILHLSPEKLRARYYTSADAGIKVRSEVGKENNHILISTLDGMELVSVTASNENGAMLWKIMGSSIFLYDDAIVTGLPGMAEYVVAPENNKRLEKELKRNHITPGLLRSLNTESVNQTKQLAFSELSARSEIETIIDMAKALGAAGVKGYENIAALSLYGLALNLAKLRDLPSESEPEEGPSTGAPVPILRRGKRSTCSRPGWFSTSYEYGCNRCPLGSDCVGLCGKGCNCWKFVCGDCCYNQGCFDHDTCCGQNGFFHYTCFLANPWNFPCSGYYYHC